MDISKTPFYAYICYNGYEVIKMSAKRITQEEFEKRVKERHGGNIKVKGRYRGTKNKVEFKCNVCSSIFETTPDSMFISIKGCGVCAGNKKKSDEQIEKEINSVEGYKYLGGYKNTHSKIRIKHKCGHEFEMVAKSFVHDGQRCPKHRYEKSAYSNYLTQGNPSEGSALLEEICAKEDYKILQGFVYGNNKFKLLCKKCGNIHEPERYAFLVTGNRCVCRSESKGERAIRHFLESEGIEFETQFRLDGCKGEEKKLPYDFALLEDNKLVLLIEFDGAQHFYPKFGEEALRKLQKTDAIKNKYCEDNNIPLIRVKYNRKNKYLEFKNQVIYDLMSELSNKKETIPSQAIQKWIEGVETNAYSPNA